MFPSGFLALLCLSQHCSAGLEQTVEYLQQPLPSEDLILSFQVLSKDILYSFTFIDNITQILSKDYVTPYTLQTLLSYSNNRTESSFQNLGILTGLVVQDCPFLYLNLSYYFLFFLILMSSNYSMISVNTSKVLELLQYLLQEIAEYQYVLEHNTNNVLTSLVSQL